jgi:hypothetical protein
MKAASLKEIKTELNTLHPDRIKELCVQMAKFRKENKELLSYLLFESQDEETYVKEVKVQMDEWFKEVKKNNAYLAKKTIRKILSNVNRQIKYSDSKRTEVELRIYFCKKLRKTGLSLSANSALGNVYLRQFLKLTKALSTLHEDLQFDYSEEIKLL